MLIDAYKVLEIRGETKCPILEMFYTEDDNKWYVCFEEYIVINGESQIVHLDEVMEKIKSFDNIENLTNEVYSDEFREGESYFEQITFEWENNLASETYLATKDTPYEVESIRRKNEYVILEVEDMHYITTFLEEHNRNYIYYFYANKTDEIWIKHEDFKFIIKRLNEYL